MADPFLAPLLHRSQNLQRFCSADEVIESVRNNIECLLNSRLSVPADYILRPTDKKSSKLLNDSLVNFGVVDFQSLNMGDPEMESRFCNSVKIAIERYEPRLARVQVEMAPSAKNRLLTTQVNAELVVEPFDEIRFESGLDKNSQTFVVT